MKNLIYTLIISCTFFLMSCGGGNKIEETKKEVEKPKTEINDSQKEVKEMVNTSAAENNSTQATEMKKEVENTTQTAANNPIVGKYYWLKTVCCGRMRKETTPETDGEKYCEFTNEGNMFTVENELRSAPKKYTYSEVGAIYKERPSIQIEDRNQSAIIATKGDTLIIDYGYMDLETQYWIKMK